MTIFDPPMTDEDWTPNNLDEFEPHGDPENDEHGSWCWHEQSVLAPNARHQPHPDMIGYTCSAGVVHTEHEMLFP